MATIILINLIPSHQAEAAPTKTKLGTYTFGSGGGNSTSKHYSIGTSTIGGIAGNTTNIGHTGVHYKIIAGFIPQTAIAAGALFNSHTSSLPPGSLITYDANGNPISYSFPPPPPGAAPFFLDWSGALSSGAVPITSQQVMNAQPISGFNIPLVFPPGMMITGPAGWNGHMPIPQVDTPINPPPIGGAQFFHSFDFAPGFRGSFSFNIPLPVKFPGDAGKIGFTETSSGVLTILTACPGNTTSSVGLSAGNACYAKSGGDLIVWTTHFSTIGDLSPSTAVVGGLGSASAPPTFTGSTFVQGEYPLTINDVPFSYPTPASTTAHAIVKTGTTTTFKILLYAPKGASTIAHVGLYTNISDTQNIGDSDTAIVWDAQKPLFTYDPHGFFSSVSATPGAERDKGQITFTITFAKPMPKSAIIFRVWDTSLNSLDTEFFSAWQAVSSSTTPTPQTTTPTPQTTTPTPQTTTPTPQTTTPTPQTTTPTPQAPQSNDLAAIKDWAGYSAHPITDSEFLKDMSINAEHIPPWVAKTTRWVVDGSITVQDFKSAVQYLYQKGIVK